MTKARKRYSVLVDLSRLLAEDDDHCDVDEVNYEEADHLPELDLAVEKHEDEVHRRDLPMRESARSDNVGNDITEKGQGVHTTFAHEGNHACDNCGDKESSSQIRAHSYVCVAADHCRHQCKHIGPSVSKREKSHARNTRRYSQFFNHVS